MSEHEKNLKSMKRKLKNMGKSMAERKKNVHDPVAHPVRFFRRDPLDPMTRKVGKKMGIELDCLANKLINRRDVINIDNSRLLEKQLKLKNESSNQKNSLYTQDQNSNRIVDKNHLTDSQL